ncbi:MAG: RNA polymerase sigma factor [Flammeovirgaceae bacterium]|nr:RNA polymerase sigma factor [Flammeovirgaceae bacterium]
MQATSYWKDQLESLHHESYMWCLSCCNYDKDMAKDVLQDVYLKIYEDRASFKEKSSLKTWLFSVIKYTSIDHMRKQPKHIEKLSVSHSQIPESEIEDNEKENAFTKILEFLSAQQREVLTLAFYHGLTLEEIAPLLKISIGSVRTHYERGKENFKKLLLKYNLHTEIL